MKRLFYYSLIVFVCACEYGDDLFKSYGDVTTQFRQVNAFNKILAGEKFDVLLIQDSTRAGNIEISAGKNVIDGYTTRVENGQLRIENSNHFNWVRKLKVRQKVVVYFKDLNEIQINGSAKFISADTIVNTSEIRIFHAGLEDAEFSIKGDYVFTECSNTGGVILKGSCFLLSASIDDISFVNSLNLAAIKTYITSFSQDDSYVSGDQILDIRLKGNGSVYYTKKPSTTLTIEDTGIGSVIEKN